MRLAVARGIRDSIGAEGLPRLNERRDRLVFVPDLLEAGDPNTGHTRSDDWIAEGDFLGNPLPITLRVIGAGQRRRNAISACRKSLRVTAGTTASWSVPHA